MSGAAICHLRMLARYTAWANACLFETLAGLPDGMLGAPRPAGGGSMGSILSHAWVVDQIWQAHLVGRAHGYTTRNTDEELPLEVLRAGQATLDQWYITYADGLNDAAHEEVVNFHFVDGGPGAMRRGDILLHVVNQKTYHRGYVADLLYHAGRRPPVMDLPVFLRDVPQAP